MLSSMLMCFITNGWNSLWFFGAGFVLLGAAGVIGHYIEMESIEKPD
jgi:hypothetical protein